MKKFVALGLSAVMGLACLGVAACGGGETDPVSLVSDKIESDEEWDRAMWDTLVALTDFDGDDDATKTYENAPYWHPEEWELTWPKNGNYKITIDYEIVVDDDEGSKSYASKQEYIVDDGKFYVHFEGDTPDGIWPYMVGEAYGKYDEQGKLQHLERYGSDSLEGTEWMEHSDLLEDDFLRALISVLDFSHLSSYPASQQFGVYNPFYYYDAEQIAADAIFSPSFYQSVFEFAKYDEEKGGYVISPILTGDEYFDHNIEDYFYVVKDSVLKFKDGKLAAIVDAHLDRYMTTTVGITYGGQKVEFPSDLPW